MFEETEDRITYWLVIVILAGGIVGSIFNIIHEDWVDLGYSFSCAVLAACGLAWLKNIQDLKKDFRIWQEKYEELYWKAKNAPR